MECKQHTSNRRSARLRGSRIFLPWRLASHFFVATSLHGLVPSAASSTIVAATQALPVRIHTGVRQAADGAPPPHPSTNRNNPTIWAYGRPIATKWKRWRRRRTGMGRPHCASQTALDGSGSPCTYLVRARAFARGQFFTRARTILAPGRSPISCNGLRPCEPAAAAHRPGMPGLGRRSTELDRPRGSSTRASCTQIRCRMLEHDFGPTEAESRSKLCRTYVEFMSKL